MPAAAPTKHSSARSGDRPARYGRAWGPLDETLQRLREHRLLYRWDDEDVRIFWAMCPACRSGGWDLRIREAGRGGPVSYFCKSGCTDDEIRDALAREPVHPRVEAAEAKAMAMLELADQARDLAARALEQLAGAATLPARHLGIARAA
jgi:hypothetical protein